MQVPEEARMGHWIPHSWRERWGILSFLTRVLVTELQSSARSASILNCSLSSLLTDMALVKTRNLLSVFWATAAPTLRRTHWDGRRVVKSAKTEMNSQEKGSNLINP